MAKGELGSEPRCPENRPWNFLLGSLGWTETLEAELDLLDLGHQHFLGLSTVRQSFVSLDAGLQVGE